MDRIQRAMRQYTDFFNEWVAPIQAVGYIVGENVVPESATHTALLDGREYHAADIICPEGAVFTRAMCDRAIQCGVTHVLVNSRALQAENDGTDPDKAVPENLGGLLS